MEQFLEKIRTHFNIIHKDDYLSLTLINPNLDLDIIKEIKSTFRLQHHIKKQQIIIIESVTFDDELLRQLAAALPQSLQDLTLDFTGCESIRGDGFVQLFERLSSMDLKRLKLDLSEVYDVNDLVMQSLSLLLQSLQDLQQFYLDLYEVDQITEDGYLILAESLTSLNSLHSLHLDFSANPNLTEDSLQLMFTNLKAQNLIKFQFRILDIDHIGGGSFFKLGQTISKMVNLQSIDLTISTFSNINHKGIYAILKEITYLQKLREVSLNLSNIKLPQKIMSYLNLPSAVQSFSLDLSCNSFLTDADILTLIKNVKNLCRFSINLDFCNKISDDSLEQLLEIYLITKKCKQLSLPDRNYSPDFIRFLIKKGTSALNLTRLQIGQLPKEVEEEWKSFQSTLKNKQQLQKQLKQDEK